MTMQTWSECNYSDQIDCKKYVTRSEDCSRNPVSTWTETSSEATKCMKTNRLHENIIGEDYKVMSENIQQWSYHNETMIKWTHVHQSRNQEPSMYRQYACETILHECTEATSQRNKFKWLMHKRHSKELKSQVILDYTKAKVQMTRLR